MSDNLNNFLIDLASNPDRMARFRADPHFEIDDAGLTDAEKAAVLAQDSRQLEDVLGAAKREIIKSLKTRKKTSKRAPARKKSGGRKGTRR
jgi:hypothetical protein